MGSLLVRIRLKRGTEVGDLDQVEFCGKFSCYDDVMFCIFTEEFCC